MKKVALILLLFCAKTVAAQSLYVGVDAGAEHFAARQFNNAFYPEENYFYFGPSVQYLFKGNRFGYEGHLNYMPTYANAPLAFIISSGESDNTYISTFTTANYFSYNILHKYQKVSLQLGLGFFYSHFFSGNVSPENDLGPAVAINLSYKISQKAYLSIELSQLYGLTTYNNYYYFTLYADWPTPQGTYPTSVFTGGGNYNLTYTTLMLKYIHKI